jgi:hypothetical protein
VISRVAGQREPAPPSNFGNDGGLSSNVFVTIADYPQQYRSKPLNFQDNCAQNAEIAKTEDRNSGLRAEDRVMGPTTFHTSRFTLAPRPSSPVTRRSPGARQIM